MLERENPKIVTKLKTDDENWFEYLYLTFGPSIYGFVSCYIYVITIDGNALKERIGVLCLLLQ